MIGPFLSYYIQTLRLCAMAVASALLGPVFLVMLPQGIEVLRTLDDTTLMAPGRYPDEFTRDLAFLAALVLWSLANWYGARLLLQRQLGLPMTVQFTPEAARWRKWLPRSLIVVGALPVALKLAQLGQVATAAAVVVACGGVYLFAVYRRQLASMFGGTSTRRTIATVPAGGLRSDLPEGEELSLYLAAAFALVMVIALSTTNYGLSRALGAAAILLLALAGIGLALNVLLIYLPRTSGWPAFTGAAVVVSILFGSLGLTANHGIAGRRVEADAQARVVRPLAHQYWQQWMNAPTTPKEGPLYLVAAEGGASRSAWWSGHVLSVLDDATGGDFGRRVFAVSGVSGGSLGIAAWVALHRDAADGRRQPAYGAGQSHAPRREQCEVLQGAGQSLATSSACFLGGDFVSTTLGYLVGVDFLQRAFPAPIASWDRSQGLEATWAQDWYLMFGTGHFSRPLMDLYRGAGPEAMPLRTDLPLLIINTTSAGQGRPVVQSAVRMPDPEVDDLLDPALRTAGLTLATAVHNSARFPYVSPGGDIVTARGDYYDSVVDGGYVENSGALALGTLMRSIASGQGDSPAWEQFRKRLVVVFIANDPDEPVADGASLCDARPRPLDLAPRQSWGEAATPPVGLFMVRAGRAAVSRRALLRELHLCEPATAPPVYFVSMASPPIREVRPAMSWYMRPDSRDAMWRAVATQPARPEMRRLLEQWAEQSHGDKPEALARLDRFGG
jgi:hypothetical protein